MHNNSENSPKESQNAIPPQNSNGASNDSPEPELNDGQTEKPPLHLELAEAAKRLELARKECGEAELAFKAILKEFSTGSKVSWKFTIRRPLLPRQTRYDLSSIDWTQTTPEEAANKVGCSTAYARIWRSNHVGVFDPSFKRAPNRVRPQWKVDPSTLDWSLQDIVLSKMAGVSRERIRQIRRKLGKPNPDNYCRHTESETFRIEPLILAMTKEELEYSTADVLARKLETNKQAVINALNKHYLKCLPERLDIASHMNFNLPLTTLGRIWNRSTQAMMTARKNMSATTTALWRLGSGGRYGAGFVICDLGHTEEEFNQAVKAEQEKHDHFYAMLKKYSGIEEYKAGRYANHSSPGL